MPSQADKRAAAQELNAAIRDIFENPLHTVPGRNLDHFCAGCGYLLPVCHCHDPDPEAFEPQALDGIEVREPDQDDIEHRGMVEFGTFREGEYVEAIYVTREHAAHIQHDLDVILQPVAAYRYPAEIKSAMEQLKDLAASLELSGHSIYAAAAMALWTRLQTSLVRNGDLT